MSAAVDVLSKLDAEAARAREDALAKLDAEIAHARQAERSAEERLASGGVIDAIRIRVARLEAVRAVLVELTIERDGLARQAEILFGQTTELLADNKRQEELLSRLCAPICQCGGAA